MSRGEVRVTIVADAEKFIAATRRATAAVRELHAGFRALARASYRAHMTPGERHFDQVCREILAGKPGRDPVVRLTAAADFAALLDGKGFAA